LKKSILVLSLACFIQGIFAQDKLLNILKNEADRNIAVLKSQPVPAYYVSYRVFDSEGYGISSSFGKLMGSSPSKHRLLHTVVRVGDHKMDNTREIKGDNYEGGSNTGANRLVLEDDPQAIQMVLWDKTDEMYKNAVRQYEKVKANVAVKVAAEDASDDFSVEKMEKYHEKPMSFKNLLGDVKKWENKVRKYSEAFADNKDVISGNASFNVELVRKYFVDSDGAEIVENSYGYRISINASTTADDGMNLPLYKSYFAHNVKDLPSDNEIIADVKALSQMVSKLRNAPIAESYSGPVLMTAKASGVFFHEIFGHRIEGARLKQESDAQTFKKKVGELVLPEDFNITFDPQLKNYRNLVLSGNYVFDDEGIRGQNVKIVENGVLRSFLMSRTPIEGFPNSNGHGRAMIYYSCVTRQSNMFVESSKAKTNQELRNLLIEEAKRTNKAYGYIIDDVSGGFTQTGRYSPNSFNVTPLVVYRIYTDGRPDELVRGVDLVGTPLAMFSQIEACGNDYAVFNGYCGAESGSIPVSCVAPSLFVKMVETQRKAKSQNQPPVLERP
jgi:predicted Zn-dependent protease